MSREDPHQRISQGHLAMALLAVAWQAIQTFTSLARHELGTALLGAIGLLASLSAVTLVRRKTLSEHTIRQFAVPAAVAWLVAQLAVDLLKQQVAFLTYFNYLIVVTLAFSVWNTRQAVRLTVLCGVLLLLACLAGRTPDLLVLNAVLFTAALIGYMSTYSIHLRDANHRARKAEAMMVRDQVTGLLQRDAALSQMRAMQNESFPDATHLAVSLLKIEALNEINRVHGYGSGDRTLQMVSIVLLRNCGPQDIVARWSGTQFLVTLRNANRREAQSRLEQMLAALNAEAWPGGPRLHVNAGLALLAEADTLEEVVTLTQRRLEQARTEPHRTLVSHGSPPRHQAVLSVDES